MLLACGILPRQPPVPQRLTLHVETPACAASRYWPYLDVTPMIAAGKDADERERATRLEARENSKDLPPANFLAISGGSDDGAFAAGLLVGWSATGHRPEFKVVTGISAGALIAPFAFLGSQYDEVLHSVATSIGPDDIFHRRNVISALLSDAFADDSRLAAIIAKYITPDLLGAVAREYAKGRILLISTTDLDAGQPVIWDMGKIASSQDPGALDLFRKVVLASASVPGLFPPVMINVTLGNERFQEMHVDGGVVAEVFLFPTGFVTNLTQDGKVNERERHVYVIRNGRVQPEWRSVSRRTSNVARMALLTLIETQGINDIYGIETTAQREHEGFSVAYIDDGFTFPHKTLFDTAYLNHLYSYSYARASKEAIWKASLPSEAALHVN